MKVLSINVGLPREIFHEGRLIRTGIFKTPVSGPVRVNALNVEGNQQADLTVHGGPSKAIYVYPSEHYAFWRKELPEVEIPWGSFGENLTSEGLLEKDLNIWRPSLLRFGGASGHRAASALLQARRQVQS